MNNGPVLVSWIAVNNDPYIKGESSQLCQDSTVPGPTLTILSDPDSLYCRRIQDAVLFHRRPSNSTHQREATILQDLTKILNKQSISVHPIAWESEDPTDHAAIFEFLRLKIPEIRQKFANRELIIHLSPGTPSMHTIWVLMAETGYIRQPFTVVKSYRSSERHGRPPVVPVSLGIETFYKAYQTSRPRQVGTNEQSVLWDPARFQSQAMKDLFAEARRYAQLNVPILIRGERGTGKTTLANWIRTNSPFRRDVQDDHWPSVACGQYNPDTMRAELFGYVKGAFTGANSNHDGLLAAAHQDTLFLDEIGDVSRDLQRLLIRAIEEKTYFALGDDKPHTSQFRLITATNINDEELHRRLDPDFLDRISLFTLRLPPLREVTPELPWLWESTFAEAIRRTGLDQKHARISSKQQTRVIRELRQHPLRGNLRDLFRVAFRILAGIHDIHEPLNEVDAVNYGLAALQDKYPEQYDQRTMSKSIANAFSNNSPLDDLIIDGKAINTAEAISEYRHYIAKELRRISHQRGVAVDQLCDVTERSIREWAKPRRKVSSESRKDASD